MTKKAQEGKKATIYFLLWNLLSKSVTYIGLLILANLFSAYAYGQASYAFSIFNIVILFVLIGVPETFVPWVIKKKDQHSIVYFLSSLVGLALLIGLALFWNYSWVWPLLFVFPFFLIKYLAESFFRVEHKHHFVQIFGSLAMFVYLIFLYIFKGKEAFEILFSFSLAYVFVSLVMLWINWKYFKKAYGTVSYSLETIIPYLKKSALTTTINVSFTFLTWIDAFILGLLVNYETVAHYNVSGLLSGVILVIPISLSMFLLTRSAELTSKKTSREVLKRTLRFSYSLSLLIAIGLIAIIKPLLAFFFPQYTTVDIYILILLVGLLFTSIHYTASMYYIGKLKPHIVFIPIVFGAILNIIGDLLLIPVYGLWGVAIATTVAHFATLLFILIKIDLLPLLFPSTLLSLFVIAAYFLGWYGLLLLPFVALSLLGMKLIRKDDIVLLFAVCRKILLRR